MRNRTQAVIVVALISVIVIGLAVALAQRMGQPAPATPTPPATPTRPPTWTPTPSRAPYPAATPTPGPSPLPTEVPLPPVVLTAMAFDVTQTAVAFEPTMTAMAALGTIIPSPTPGGPTPTMTGEEQALLTEMQRSGPQSAASAEECENIFYDQDGCNVFLYAKRITRPEWEALFPRTEFFLVKYDDYANMYPPLLPGGATFSSSSTSASASAGMSSISCWVTMESCPARETSSWLPRPSC